MRIKGWGGFSAMYTSIPMEEFEAEEDRIKEAADAQEAMLSALGKSIKDSVSKLTEGGKVAEANDGKK